jgi:hypothetical protein
MQLYLVLWMPQEQHKLPVHNIYIHTWMYMWECKLCVCMLHTTYIYIYIYINCSHFNTLNTAGHLINAHKCKHILCRYSSENWKLWNGVILYLAKYTMCLHIWCASRVLTTTHTHSFTHSFIYVLAMKIYTL